MNRQSMAKNITGLGVLLIGTALLFNSLEVININHLVSNYWPLAVVAGGILVLINSWQSWPVSMFLIALGILYQLRLLDVIDVEPWAVVWPLILILIGASLVFGRSYRGSRASKSERDDVTAIMAGANVKNHSKSFKQSNATAIMGAARLDLREAEFDKEALVEVFGFWGGVEIIVPENVILRNQVFNVMAGTEDKTEQKTDKNSPVLTIVGTMVMSGASIRNKPSDSW